MRCDQISGPDVPDQAEDQLLAVHPRVPADVEADILAQDQPDLRIVAQRDQVDQRTGPVCHALPARLDDGGEHEDEHADREHAADNG